MSDGIWHLDSHTATLQSTGWDATFDTSHPSNGLKVVIDDQVVTDNLFSFLVNDEPTDCYVRNADLVLRYPARTSDLVSFETYFRANQDRKGLELILSAQTSLLESKPQTKVTTTFPDATIQTIRSDSPNATSYFIIRPQNQPDLSVLMLVHPSDFHRASAELAPGQITFWVLPESLEKGVIRRTRFQMRMLDRKKDEELAAKELTALQLTSPPLAT